jgi:cellulose synthase/poly-beta-1,6-N-acetylglucosamine synthase-like glycosyltransferase
MFHLSETPLILYLLLGPLAWLGMFAGYLLAASRMNRLKRALPLTDPLPTVTVLIPAKDEGKEIARCIRSVLAQDYPQFDVLAINDRSTDDTGAVLDKIAAEISDEAPAQRGANGGIHPSASRSAGVLRIIHIPKDGLPPGWLGKCHALATAAATVRSDWLLFVDSDVELQPNALTIALSNAVNRKYDAVSILTKLDCRTFWEKLVLPLAAATWAVMFTVSATNDDDRKGDAFANGQFFLIRRSAYEAAGGHAAVRDQITEDVELMRRLKSSGFRTRLLFGNHLATTRMHATLTQMLHGWGRIYSGTSRRKMGRIALGIIFLLTIALSAYPMLALSLFHPLWLPLAIAHLTLLTAYLALVYHSAGQPRRYAFLFPLGSAILLSLLIYALRMCRTGRVFWRDTHYAPWQPHGAADTTKQ